MDNNQYSNDDLKQALNSINLVDLIKEYVPSLSRRGKNYVGFCPFHNDTRHPSFTVNPEKQIYKCFTCGEYGNAITFVEKKESLSFPEAVSYLSEKYNLGLGNIKVVNTDNDKYYEILEKTNKYFRNNLNSDAGKEAYDYLINRKLNDDIIKEFEIGLSLDTKSNLTDTLVNMGYNLEDLNSVNVSNKNIDVFKNRIMFPLHDKDGRTVAFSGRIYHGEDSNKYLNSEETKVFKKGSMLFNYHRAKESIKSKDYVIVMEGFMAVIRAYTNGVKNCIATMGTALTNEQASMIKRLSNNVYLCYDGDDAGHKAILKNADKFIELGCNLKVIYLDDKLDPDDYIIKYGIDSFNNLINNAVSFSEYKISLLKDNYNLNNVSDKKEYIHKVVDEISKIDDEIERLVKIEKLSSEVNISQEDLKEIVNNLIENKDYKEISIDESSEIKREKKDNLSLSLNSLVYYMINFPDNISIVEKENLYIKDKNISNLVDEIIEYYNSNGNIDENDFLIYISYDKELESVLRNILSYNYNDENVDVTMNVVINTIKKYTIKEDISRLEEEYKNEKDLNKKIEIMEQIRKLKLRKNK